MRATSRIAAEARRSSTEQRLKELEDLVGDDDEISSMDDVTVPLEPAAVPPAAASVRFQDLPQELPRAIPFLPEPGYRAFAANVAGDSGFDPLGLCTDVEKFIDYREAELKHGRLAMIVAFAFPLVEATEQLIQSEESGLEGVPDLLAESGGRALPSLTGGSGDLFIGTFAALVILFGSAFELTARRRGSEPGDVGFDPLSLRDYKTPPFIMSFIPPRRSWMAEAEVQHCRLGMIAVAYDIIDEVLTGNPVIEDTEAFLNQLDDKLLEFRELTAFGQTLDIPESLKTGEFPSSL